MNENNNSFPAVEQPLSGQEANAAETDTTETNAPEAVAAEIAPAPVMEISPRPKERGAKTIIAALLAVALAAGGALAYMLLAKPDPEKVVKEAVAVTYAQQQKLEDDIYEQLPAVRQLFMPEQRSAQSDFELTLTSIEGFSYADLANALLSDTSLSGSVASSPEHKTADMSLELGMKGSPLISGRLFLSPELAAASVPSLSEKYLSVNPSTFVEDFKNSIFYSPDGYSDEDLQLMQQSIDAIIENPQSYGSIDAEKMNDDVMAIMSKATVNAVYGFDKESGLYTVSLPGGDVKAAFMEVYRYIYLDSELAAMMEGSMSSMLSPGENGYRESMEQMLSELDTAIPELPAEIALTIENKQVKTANIVLTPAASENPDGLSFGPINMDMNFTENSTNVSYDMEIFGTDTPIKMAFDVSASFADGIYLTSFNMDISDEEFSLTFPFELSFAADGAFSFKGSIDGASADESFSAQAAMLGTMLYQDEIFSYDLTDCSVGGGMDGVEATLRFTLSGGSAPLAEAPAAPAEHIPVLALNEEKLMEIYDEYSAAANSLIGRIYGLFM